MQEIRTSGLKRGNNRPAQATRCSLLYRFLYLIQQQ